MFQSFGLPLLFGAALSRDVAQLYGNRRARLAEEEQDWLQKIGQGWQFTNIFSSRDSDQLLIKPLSPHLWDSAATGVSSQQFNPASRMRCS